MRSLVVTIPSSPICGSANRRYSPFKSGVGYFFRRYGLVAFFIAVLFSGMIFGAVKAGTADEAFIEKLEIVFSSNISVREEQTITGAFVNSFGTSFLFLLMCFCFSMSPFGILLVPAVMFFRGFGFGISSGFLCISYGFKGLVYYILVMLVGAFLSSMALVYVSQYCFDFSKEILLSITGREGILLKRKLVELVFNCGYMVILIIFASLVDAGLYFLVGGLFSF